MDPWDWEKGPRDLVAPTEIRRLIVALELLKSNKNGRSAAENIFVGLLIVGVTGYAGGMLVYCIY